MQHSKHYGEAAYNAFVQQQTEILKSWDELSAVDKSIWMNVAWTVKEMVLEDQRWS